MLGLRVRVWLLRVLRVVVLSRRGRLACVGGGVVGIVGVHCGEENHSRRRAERGRCEGLRRNGGGEIYIVNGGGRRDGLGNKPVDIRCRLGADRRDVSSAVRLTWPDENGIAAPFAVRERHAVRPMRDSTRSSGRRGRELESSCPPSAHSKHKPSPKVRPSLASSLDTPRQASIVVRGASPLASPSLSPVFSVSLAPSQYRSPDSLSRDGHRSARSCTPGPPRLQALARRVPPTGGTSRVLGHSSCFAVLGPDALTSVR